MNDLSFYFVIEIRRIILLKSYIDASLYGRQYMIEFDRIFLQHSFHETMFFLIT